MKCFNFSFRRYNWRFEDLNLFTFHILFSQGWQWEIWMRSLYCKKHFSRFASFFCCYDLYEDSYEWDIVKVMKNTLNLEIFQIFYENYQRIHTVLKLSEKVAEEMSSYCMCQMCHIHLMIWYVIFIVVQRWRFMPPYPSCNSKHLQFWQFKFLCSEQTSYLDIIYWKSSKQAKESSRRSVQTCGICCLEFGWMGSHARAYSHGNTVQKSKVSLIKKFLFRMHVWKLVIHFRSCKCLYHICRDAKLMILCRSILILALPSTAIW